VKTKTRTQAKTRIAIVACKWHPLTAMENAAKDGFTFAPDIVAVPVKCKGVVTTAFLLKLFAKGMEGVLVLGCSEGDCHYYNGAERCKDIVKETREILELSGIAPERLGFHQVEGSTSRDFEEALKAFVKQFKHTEAGRKLAARRG
jgi:F420-non-reducing hydrogenase iron-sulfur subunit